MANPSVMILRTAGTNCDLETGFAFEKAGARVESVHVNRLTRGEVKLNDFQILAIPGGFSYGDDVSAGKILANQMIHHLGEQLGEFVQADRLILGICNGFQVLIKTGLLPGGTVSSAPGDLPATLTSNDSGRFEDRWVHLAPGSSKCVFFPQPAREAEAQGCVIHLPIAHGEGKFVVRDEETLRKLREGGQIAFRYVDAEGRSGPFPINPNGSMDDIAGLCDPTGRILGLMPHPERHVLRHQGPHWTRQSGNDGPGGDGFALFANAVAYFN